jgi:uncharacterized protein DUF3460
MTIGRIWRRFTALFQDNGDAAASGAGRQPLDRHYVSEFTTFMNQYLEEHPEVVADQARGRAIYWDKKQDFEALQKEAADSTPAESYVYFPLFRRQPPRSK